MQFTPIPPNLLLVHRGAPIHLPSVARYKQVLAELASVAVPLDPMNPFGNQVYDLPKRLNFDVPARETFGVGFSQVKIFGFGYYLLEHAHRTGRMPDAMFDEIRYRYEGSMNAYELFTIVGKYRTLRPLFLAEVEGLLRRAMRAFDGRLFGRKSLPDQMYFLVEGSAESVMEECKRLFGAYNIDVTSGGAVLRDNGTTYAYGGGGHALLEWGKGADNGAVRERHQSAITTMRKLRALVDDAA